MAYKLAEEDKLCGVIYPTYEGFSPIPKATCEMLESKCDKTEIIVKCKDNQSEEDKKPESQSGSASASTSESTSVSNSVSESSSESTSVSESTSESNSTSESTSESQASTSESTSESTSTESTSESTSTESTSTSESTSVSDSTSTSESTSAESVSTSESNTTSTSESTSDSTSTSKSDSTSSSESTSTSESNSVSESTTESTTTSESTSVSTSESASSSTENSNTPEEPKPTPEPQPEPVPTPVLTNEELDNIVTNKLSTEGTLGKYNANQNNKLISVDEPTPEEIEAYKKQITDKVGDITELKGYTVEVSVDKIPSEAPEVGSEVTGAPLYTKVVKITKPNGEVYQSEPMSIGTTTETNIDLLEALPRVEDKFSKVITKDDQVVEVPEVSNEDKRAFEDKIINDLKAKLPEGTTVEAVLEGPKYEKGSEVLSGKTNYVLNVRTTLNGVVSEQTYNVPHTEEAPREEPEAPEVDIDAELVLTNLGAVNIDGDTILSINIPNKIGGGQGTPITESNLPSISENYRESLEKTLNKENNTSKKYKVNSYNITMLKHVGDHSYYDDTIFTYTTTITKPNGEVVTKEGKLHSTFIETL